MSYKANKEELLHFIRNYEYKEEQPEVVMEAVNNYIKLIDFAGDRTGDQENTDILESCLEGLLKINEKMQKGNFRYRLKVRDNLVTFGQLLHKNNRDFYTLNFIPTLNDFYSGLEGDAKFTLAEALVTLGISNENYIRHLTSVMQAPKEKKVSFWRKYGAAVALMQINDKNAHDYLFAEMQPYKKNRLTAAMLLGEVMVRDNAIIPEKAGLQKVIDCLKEGIRENPNKFQRDYANAVLARLSEARAVPK